MMEGKEILSFSFNTDNVTQKEIVEIVENYTKDWRTSGDISNVSMFVTLPKSKANELALDLKMEDVYDIERNESRYAKGGSTYQGGGEIKTSQLELHKWYTIDGKELRYFGERGGQYAFQTKNYQEVLFTKPKLDKATIKGISTYQGGGEIKYMVWVGDMPLDINGREELTLEEAELLKREWEEKGYDDVAIDKYSKGGSTYQGGGEIKYMVWVGDMPLDINGREELTLEEAELLKREWEEKGYDDVAIDKYSKGGSTYAEGGVITNFMKVNDVRTQLKKQGYSEAKINKAFQGVNVGMDKDYKETVIDREGLKNNLPTQDWKDLATNVVSIIKSDSTYAEGGEIFEYKVKQYSNNHTIKELSEIEDKLLKTKNKSKAQQENLMAITTAIGVKRNPDFYKDKMFKGGSTYAEGGSIEDNQPVIRYYFEDEEYEYAQGGMVEHGLQIGDKILSKGIRTIKVENSGKKYVVNLQNGTREDSSEFYFNKKK
jgi:hypothetical protein